MVGNFIPQKKKPTNQRLVSLSLPKIPSVAHRLLSPGSKALESGQHPQQENNKQEFFKVQKYPPQVGWVGNFQGKQNKTTHASKYLQFASKCVKQKRKLKSTPWPKWKLIGQATHHLLAPFLSRAHETFSPAKERLPTRKSKQPVFFMDGNDGVQAFFPCKDSKSSKLKDFLSKAPIFDQVYGSILPGYLPYYRGLYYPVFSDYHGTPIP